MGMDGKRRRGSSLRVPGLVLALLLAPGMVAAGMPNIAIILLDDLGIEYVNAFGVRTDGPPTPNLEALANGGLRFDRGYSFPVCSPTRSASLTGRWPHRYGIGSALKFDATYFLPTAEVLLPEILTDAGYDTAGIGKQHLSMVDDLYFNANGFAHTSGALYIHNGGPGGLAGLYFNPLWTTNGVTAQRSGYTEQHTLDEAQLWLDTAQSPWFLWFAFHLPHKPWHCPPAELRTLACENSDPDLKKHRAMIEAADNLVGQLIDRLQTMPGETYIFLVSDNGSQWEVNLPPTQPDRAKQTVWEGGVHVPMIGSGPGIPVGVTTTPVSVLDLFPTVLDLAGLSPPPNLDGTSLTPLFDDPQETFDRLLLVEYFEPNGAVDAADTYQLAALEGNGPYKLLREVVPFTPQKMFHIENDPWEETDLLLNPTLSSEEAAALARLEPFLDQVDDDYYINDPPVADDQSVATDEDTLVAITLVATDPDPPDDVLTYSIVDLPAEGALSGVEPDVTYTPNLDFHGADSFTFTAEDGTAESNLATVSITVHPVNDAPTGQDDDFSVPKNSESMTLDVLANDTDVDVGDLLTVTAVGLPDQGGIAINDGTGVIYTPAEDFVGLETFSYDVSDGNGGTGTGIVTVTVECEESLDCDDGLFCNGVETCSAGSCGAGIAPCFVIACDEEIDACAAPIPRIEPTPDP